MVIENKMLKEVLDVDAPFFEADDIGLVEMEHVNRIISFVDQALFIPKMLQNKKIKAAFVTEELKDKLECSDIIPIAVDDPRWCFYTLFNYLGNLNYNKTSSVFAEDLVIGEHSCISDYNVKIGTGVIIEPNVTILPDVVIGNNCIIRAGSVIGPTGFEQKRTKNGILSVFHDGSVYIGNEVEIGPLNAIIKGSRFRNTVIGDCTKLDAHVHFAHGAQIGQRGLVAASAMIAGSVTIGDDVWIGPGAVISSGLKIGDRAAITLGAVVTKDVPEDERVTGHFAIPHQKFLINLKKTLS